MHLVWNNRVDCGQEGEENLTMDQLTAEEKLKKVLEIVSLLIDDWWYNQLHQRCRLCWSPGEKHAKLFLHRAGCPIPDLKEILVRYYGPPYV